MTQLSAPTPSTLAAMPRPPSDDGVAHLEPATWAAATRSFIAKMIAEFSHERLLAPALQTPTQAETKLEPETGLRAYTLASDEPGLRYRFWARRWALDHWAVAPDSIIRERDGEPLELDALEFVLDVRAPLGLDGEALEAYLEELSASLYAEAYKLEHQRCDAAELATAGFQTIETGMRAGHPCFVVNAGRTGFDTDDYARYAPETATPLRYLWLALRRERAQFRAVDGLSYDAHLRAELGEAGVARFAASLRRRGLEPDDYQLMPVHPWQWRNKIAATLAGDIARADLVLLGPGEDRYQPQQSIRTTFNLDAPRRCYVKTALSIVNMGFVRGLSPYYMDKTPAINQWVAALVDGDETLRGCRFSILRELATMAYRAPSYERAGPRTSPRNKMMAALWRESPVNFIDPDERLTTMAALLHLDRDGRSLLAALLDHHQLRAEDWVRDYLRVYLRPLLHCYYAHDLVFMPHGENLILALREGRPSRAFMKDIGEEVVVFRPAAELPEDVGRIALDIPAEERLLSIFTDVFDCLFRFLAPILAEHCGLPEADFWRLVADCIGDYQGEHPELEARFAADDLFAPRFALSCLNRLQLRNARQMLDLADPSAGLQFHGTLANPITGYRPSPKPDER